ncbi:general substrate transporter [Aspergillus spectabilis]
MGLSKYTPDWIHDKGSRSLYPVLPIVILSSSYQGFDGMIMNGLQLLPGWQERPVLDRFGRRKAIAFSASRTLLGAALEGSALQGSAHQIPKFVISRLLIGFGLAFAVVGSPLLLAELAFSKHRGTVLSYFPTAWYIGSIIAAWTTFGRIGTRHINNSWSWRVPSLLQAGLALIQIFLIVFFPESPRWLISHGLGAEAKAFLTKYHANGDENSPVLELEYSETKDANLQGLEYKRREAGRTLSRLLLTGGDLSLPPFVFSGNGLVQYYLHSVLLSTGITSTATQTTINGCLAIYNFVIAIIASLFVEKVGRRKLFLISTAGMFVAFILWTTFAAPHAAAPLGHRVLVSIFLSNGAYDIGWTPLWGYPAELLPFEVRAHGVAYMTGVMHISGFFSTFVNPVGLENIGWRYYIVYIVYTGLEFLAVWYFFVETRGFTLEEIWTMCETPGLS